MRYINLLLTLTLTGPTQWRIYHWVTWAMPPPFELQKISHMAKNATKMRHFHAKISKILCGEGTAPSPDPTPTGEGNTPDQTPRPWRRSPQPPPSLFPISIIALDSDAVIDEFGKSNRCLQFS